MKKTAKILYITSLGHSGSTLLDLLSGTIPGVFSMGEVKRLSWQLLQGEIPTDPQTYCSCGDNFKNCVFWGKILDEINQENSVDVFNNPREYDFSLNSNIVRYKDKLHIKIINKILEYSLKYSLIKFLSYPVYWYYLPSVKRVWNMFDKVASHSKSEYVVDSSKDFLHYWLLRMHRPEDVKLIILIRDLKGVASSSHSGLTQELINTRAKHWLKYYNEIVQPAFKLDKKYYKIIKYEDICQNPNDARKDIAEYLELAPLKNNIEHLTPSNYHTVQGNPMRLIKKSIRIKYDERWRVRLTKSQQKDLDMISTRLKMF